VSHALSCAVGQTRMHAGAFKPGAAR